MNRGGSMNVIVLFIVSFVALIGAAFLYMKSENNAYFDANQKVKSISDKLDEIMTSPAFQHTNEIWPQLNQLEEKIKEVDSRLSKKIDYTDAIAHEAQMRIGGKDARGNSLAQKVVVEFTPLHVRVDKHITKADHPKTPLSDRAGIPSSKANGAAK